MVKNKKIGVLIFSCFFLVFIFNTITPFISNTTFEDQENSVEIDFPNLKNSLDSTVNESLSQQVIISNTSGESNSPSISVDSNRNIHIVWGDNTDGTYEILYRNFTYSTQTWGDLVNLSQSNENSIDPHIEVDSSDNIHVVWSEVISGTEINIHYKWFSNTIKQWSSIKIISDIGNAADKLPKIATDGTDIVTFCWQRQQPAGPGTYNITVAYYNFNPGSDYLIDTEEIFDGIAEDSYDPSIVYSNNGVLHVIYTDNDQIIRYKNKTGSTWDPGKSSKGYDLSSTLPDTNYGRFPSIAYDKMNDLIYVCWSHIFLSLGTKYNIVLKTKHVNGNFTDNFINITDSTDDDQSSALEIDASGNIFCTYQRNSINTYLSRVNNSIELLVSESNINNFPDLEIDVNGSIHVAWQFDDTVNPTEIHYKVYDTHLPQLSVSEPTNDTIIAGNITIKSTADYDLKEINYFYFNDTNNDGVANGTDVGESWHQFGALTLNNKSVGWDYVWETNSTNLNLKSAILKVNATDKNGLDDSIYIRNLTIDNTHPELFNLLEIYDDSVSQHNSSIGDRHFNGTVTIKYEVFDNNTGVFNVSLYNGTTFLGYNDTFNDKIVIDTAIDPLFTDGNYSALKIVAYDLAGNYNESSFDEIEIDNTYPIIQYNLVNNSEVTGNFKIKILSVSDVQNVTLWNATSYDLVGKTQILTFDGRFGDWWNFTYDSAGVNSTTYFAASATDEMNYTTLLIYRIFIDNKDPNATILNFANGGDIGRTYTPIYIEVDIDTVNVTLWFRDNLVSPFVQVGFNNTFNQVDDFRKNTSIMFYEAETVNTTTLYLIASAIDDIGFVSNASISLDLITANPSGLPSVIHVLNNYNVTLSWLGTNESKYFLIYRTYINYDEDYLNDLIKDSQNEFFNLLGRAPGEKSCVALILNNTGNTKIYSELLFGPNIYYYHIIVVDLLEIPSEVYQIEITITAEQVNREIQNNQTQDWPIYFIIFFVIIAVISEIQVKRIKKQHYKGRVGTQFGLITKQSLATFEETGIDLDARAPGEITMGAISQPKKVGRYAEIIKEEDVATFDEQKEVKIENCPTCGWILSSTAIKCPRCGWRKIV